MTDRRRTRQPTTGATPERRTGPARTTLTDAEADARALTLSWYADRGTLDDEDLLAPVEENEGIIDEEIPDGILDHDDDDLPEFATATDPELMRSRWRPTPHIVFWRAGASVHYEVRPPSDVALSDPLIRKSAIAHAARLETTGAALANLQRESLLAGSMASALRRLVRLPKKRVASEIGVESDTGSLVSRNRFMVVEAPFGLVSLDFFTWASTADWERRIAGIEVMDSILHSEPGASANALGLRAAKEAGGSRDVLRKHVSALRAVRKHPDIVALHRRAYPQTSWQDLRNHLGLAGDDKTKPVMCMALAGILGPGDGGGLR